MKRILQVTLGIVTSIGGFLEVGAVATSAQGGAAFGFQLGWAIALGAICLIFLIEMSGRLAALSKHTIMDAIRARFGFPFSVIPLVTVLLVSFLVMASEIGGVCLALQLVSGVSIQWWAVPVALAIWWLLWKGTFGLVEQGASILGLVTIAFAVGAFKLHPAWGPVAHGLIPTLPSNDAAHYWFLAVSILGAAITPAVFFFYSSGAVEAKWDANYLTVNRVSAIFGMAFGATLALAVLVVAAVVFRPHGIHIDTYDQVALMLTGPLGRWGFYLFAASLGIACFGAASEIALTSGYMMAQEFGWNWSEDLPPSKDARFAIVYTVVVLLAAVPMLLGVDPLKLTVISMVLSAASLPPAIIPFLIIMNDGHYVGEHTNGWIGNTVVTGIVLLSFVLAVISLPLELMGG